MDGPGEDIAAIPDHRHVSPLVALMQDQVAALRLAGVAADLLLPTVHSCTPPAGQRKLFSRGEHRQPCELTLAGHWTLTAPTTAGATMPTRQTHGFRNPAMRAVHIEKRAGMPL